MLKNQRFENLSIILLLLFFASVYGSISLVNHYFFRTHTLDLGFYNNAIYDYRNLRWNYSLIIFETPANILGGHFEPVLFLFAPFSYLFGSYTLLIIQIVFLIWGGFSIYNYFKDSGKIIALISAATFFGYFTVIGALSFDFHTNVIAASCLPFFFLSIKRNRFWHFVFVFIFMLICKENISLWLFFICLGLAFQYRKNVLWRNRFFLFSFFSLSYFILVIYAVIPTFSSTKAYTGFLYETVGKTPYEAFMHIISNPVDVIRLLFVDTDKSPHHGGVKMEFHTLLLFSGLPFLFFRPSYFFMLIPLYLQKMLHNEFALWGVEFHYSVEFAPIMVFGIFDCISHFKNELLKIIVAAFMLILNYTVSIFSFNTPFAIADKSNIKFYRRAHYTKKYDVKAVHNILEEIPSNVSISAQSVYLPHLAFRDHIYLFPMVKDATYIIYSFKESPYPLNDSTFYETTQSYQLSENWDIWQKTDEFYVLKRNY